jgi:hypothetical protein
MDLCATSRLRKIGTLGIDAMQMVCKSWTSSSCAFHVIRKPNCNYSFSSCCVNIFTHHPTQLCSTSRSNYMGVQTHGKCYLKGSGQQGHITIQTSLPLMLSMCGNVCFLFPFLKRSLIYHLTPPLDSIQINRYVIHANIKSAVAHIH